MAQAETQLYQTQSQLIDLGVQRAQFEHAIAILIGKAPVGVNDSRRIADGAASAGAGGRAVGAV